MMLTKPRQDLQDRLARAFATWADAHAQLGAMRAQAASTAWSGGVEPDSAPLVRALRWQEAACARLWKELTDAEKELASAREARRRVKLQGQAERRDASSKPQQAASIHQLDTDVEILIVDDQPSNLTALEAVLDASLPGMSGFEVAQQLRAQPQSRDALLIALTGYGEPEVRSRSTQAGFDSHMTKPADLGLLLSMITEPRDGPGTSEHVAQAADLGQRQEGGT